MRKLILHIGAHKTGTTSIQKFLFDNKDTLKKSGWTLFNKKPDGLYSIQGNANQWVSFTGELDNFKANIDEQLFCELSNINSNTILSCEELFWLYTIEEIEEFVSKLKDDFDEIKLICYLRRQDKHLLSHFQQGFKYPYSSAPSFYGAVLQVIPDYKEYFSRYLNYYKKLETWSKYIESDNIIVREYSREKLIDGDAVSDFISQTGLPIQKKADFNESNESLNSAQVILNHNLFKLRHDLWYDMGGHRFTRSIYFEDSVKPKLSLVDSLRILEFHYSDNKKLRRYIPDLDQSWTSKEFLELDSTINDKMSANSFAVQDYEKVIVGLLMYLDNQSLTKVLGHRLRKALSNTGIKFRLKKYLVSINGFYRKSLKRQ